MVDQEIEHGHSKEHMYHVGNNDHNHKKHTVTQQIQCFILFIDDQTQCEKKDGNRSCHHHVVHQQEQHAIDLTDHIQHKPRSAFQIVTQVTSIG